jgi:glycosyltransferase involved in cell wall biosynthesis
LIQEEPCVSIITPISGVGLDLSNLRLWLKKTEHLPIKTILIHDEIDSQVHNLLEHMVEDLGNPLVTLHHGRFGSPGAARNRGLEFVTTEKVVFWDSDDTGEPLNLIQAINKHKDSKVIVGSFTINSDFQLFDKKLINLRNDHTLEIQLGVNPGIWRYIFDYAVIRNYRFSTTKMGEDQQFLIEIQAIPHLLTITELTLYNYFVGNQNHLTSQQSAKSSVIQTFRSAQEFFVKRSQKLNLFETTIYLKLLWSSIKYAQKPRSFSTLLAFLYLTIFLRKIYFENLIQITRFLRRQERIVLNGNE